MKLKHVELYGFKSFAEKTKLSFNKDISAVVGPNGSGKSNIADAVRWVLGEQSAKSLRGSSMQDVIFAGSETKKQMNMAQVSLVLDNSDNSLPIAFDQVNVTRRVFRTGESEYLINKSPVRLREIKELFFDTGIGKDGYSLIGQGRIDEILAGKPEERREIFEEASGISGNKHKKLEAERRLVRNEENLEKLASEIKVKQQEADILEIQSNNAKEGIKLTSRLEILELNLLKRSIEKASSDLENDNARLELINTEIKEKTKNLHALMSLINPIQSQISEKEDRFEKLRDLSFSKERKAQELKSQISILEEKTKFYQSDIERLEFDLSNKNSRIDKMRIDVNNKEKEKHTYTKSKDDLKLKLDKIVDDIEKNKKQYSINKENLDKINHKLDDSRIRLANLRVDKNTKEKLDINNEKLKSSYNDELLNLSEIIKDKRSKYSDIEESINSIQKNISENTQNIDRLIQDREIINTKLRDLIKDINEKSNHNLRLESEKDILERQYKSYEGYYRSVQDLLKISDRDKFVKDKIVGVLADLIQIDDKYTEALEVALGSALQNIVVNDENDGKYLINLIKKKNIGRITFLPISNISGRKSKVTHPLAIDTLNNLVEYDKKIESIIDYYLSKTILVKDMDDAIKVSRDLKGFRLITLDGDIINAWGSMVGGKSFRKEQNSLVNRKKELDRLNKDLYNKKSQIDNLRQELAKDEKILNDIENKLQNIDDKNREDLQNVNNLKNSLREVKIEIAFNEKRYNEYQSLLDNILLELSQEDFSSLDELSIDIENKEAQAKELQNKIDQINNEIIALDKESIKYKADYEVVTRDLKFLITDIDNLYIDIENTEKSISNDKASLDYTKEQIKNSKAIIIMSNEKLLTINNTEVSDRKELENLSLEIKDSKTKIEADRLKIDLLKNDLSENEKEKYKIELRIENASQKVNDLKSNYLETYSLDEETLEGKLNRIEKVETSRKEISEIKSRLSEIGYFNFESIEQYSIISEELDFMKKQFQDLLKSKDDIIGMIKKIEKEMKENFVEAFEKIRLKFNDIFRVLFDGGEADLTLDSDDILNAGVDIIAKPKGKKLKSIALLSGGERAMTAVALLFAIFETNPAPFCVLDEIDAALDEANIKRYINYLQSLTEKTQFIIITHRKATMEMAEILYGVTMEEQGISKVVTLALDKYN